MIVSQMTGESSASGVVEFHAAFLDTGRRHVVAQRKRTDGGAHLRWKVTASGMDPRFRGGDGSN